jgi:uncharacterized membrane protein YdjX (TVP38/TMEM64 family)
MKRSKSWLLWLLALGAIALFAWVFRNQLQEFWHFASDRQAFIAYIYGFGIWGPVVLASLHVLQVIISMLPGDVFYFAAGYVYGLQVGFLLNLTITIGAGFLAFMIARRWGRPVVDRLAPARVIDRWDAAARKHGFVFFLLSYMLPLFPTDTMNYLAGLTTIPWHQFLLASLIGRGPLIFLVTLLGAHGTDVAALGLDTVAWVIIGIAVVSLYILWIVIFRRLISGVFEAMRS